MRRLTDESTNDIVPLRRRLRTSGFRCPGAAGACRPPLAIVPLGWRPRADPGLFWRSLRARARGGRARCLRGRREPHRGTAQGGDGEADRARLPSARDEEHDAGRRQGPVADAAAVRERRLSRPTAASRPPAVTLVNKDDWRGAIAAAALMAPPVRAPVLLDRRRTACPRRPRRARLARAAGIASAKGAQAFGSVTSPRPGGLRTRRSPAGTRSTLGGRHRLSSYRRRGPAAPRVVIASANDPRLRCRPQRGRRSPVTPCCSRTRTSCRRRRVRAIKRHEQPGDLRARPAGR